jgi:hypothetical protein
MLDQIKLTGDNKIDGKIVENHLRNEATKVDRGFIGDLLGSPNSIPRNVASVIALVSASVFLFSIMLWAGNEGFGYKDAVAATSGLLTLTIGYLFGRSSRD